MAFIDTDDLSGEGADVQPHRHPNEEVLNVLDGELESLWTVAPASCAPAPPRSSRRTRSTPRGPSPDPGDRGGSPGRDSVGGVDNR